MKLKSAHLVLPGLLLSLSLASSACAQLIADDPDWKESEVPPPPAFDVGKLVTFEVNPNASLVYGVDPAAVRISQVDGIVRYVMVATSASGARNVLYEGIRCATGELKTYGRYAPESGWKMVSQPEWGSLFANMPSKHALRFARAGGCDNAAVPQSVDSLVRRLKSPNFRMEK